MTYLNLAIELAQRDEGTRYCDKALTCCERNAHRLPTGCNQGRKCPERLSTQAQAEIWTRISNTIDQETSCPQ